MAVPQRLAQHLINAGHWDVNSVGRNARGRRCRDCGDWVLAGLDGDRCAEAVHVDPTPLSALGEAMALIAGKGTYALRREGPAFRIDHRHRWAIAAKPAGTPGQRYDVVASHACSDTGPTGPLAIESVLIPPKVSNHEHPPF